ncbi:hypothetical protein ACFVSK_21165, partial [Cellulosimicrobium cellulans]|uniref:hypothetical protein n=1 Tax=Cellulosimicrobium cellulans TaxID=1710 RepID=UPI0036E6E8E2
MGFNNLIEPHFYLGGILKLNTITIAAPVRDRDWILQHYLDAIVNVDYPKNLIDLRFVVNDSTDRTLEILTDFKSLMNKYYRGIYIDIYNRNVPVDQRELNVRNNYIYDHLSKLKNFIISRTKTDYLLFLDADILVPTDIINNLLKHQKDIVSGLIWNGHLTNPDQPYLYPNLMRLQNGIYRHILNRSIRNASYKPTTPPPLLKVDLTGAVILIRRKAYKSVKYGFHPQGEDAYFCNIA